VITGRLNYGAGQEPGVVARRILVVDDHRDTREIYALLLRGCGYVVHEAADGPAALDVLQHAHIDVAVVDIGLPGMDGYEVARTIRADESHSGILLVAVTGYGSPEARARAHEAGFDRHLVKPVTPEEFLGILE
jgi:CheY-like chemotaxis protein